MATGAARQRVKVRQRQTHVNDRKVSDGVGSALIADLLNPRKKSAGKYLTIFTCKDKKG